MSEWTERWRSRLFPTVSVICWAVLWVYDLERIAKGRKMDFGDGMLLFLGPVFVWEAIGRLRALVDRHG